MRRAALFLIFFSPALAFCAFYSNNGTTLLFEDGLLAQFPFRVFLRNAFINGYSPQWMPNSACGISLLAEGQSGICFPATQIIYRLFSAEAGWIIEIISAQAVAFALCYLFLRQFRLRRIGALFGAFVYAFSAFAFSATNVPALMWSYSLLPGIFLACNLFLERRPFAFVYVVIIFSLLFLIGHPVMMIYIGMIIAVFHAVQIIRERPNAKNFREIGTLLLALTGAVLAAMIIASPQLLPIVHEFPFSARTTGAGITLETLQNTMHLNPIWAALSLFPTPPRWGEWGFWSNHIRFPFYALFLGFIGMLSGAPAHRRGYFIFLCVFSVLMALGPYVGLWKIVHSLPGLSHLRFPFRWLFFLPICVSFFSARGADYLINAPVAFPSLYFRRILKSILAGGVVAGILFFIRFHNELLQHTQRALECTPWLTCLLLICSLGMVIAAFRSLTQSTARSGLALGIFFTVISLFATFAFQSRDPMVIRNLGMIGWRGDNLPSEPQQYRTSSALLPYDVWMTDTIRRHYPYTPNLTILNGTLATGYYFSFFPYWSANISAWCQDALGGDHKKQIYLNLSSAKWLFIAEDSLSEKLAFPTESFKGMKAYKNTGALPRASVVFSSRLFPNESDLVAFLESSNDFEPRQCLAILKQDAEAWNSQYDADHLKTAAIPPKASIVAERPDRIEIELEQAAPMRAFLVLSDTYYPGWRALVDGVEKKVVRANYAFRGIQLPQGAKHVVFYFDPLVPDAALPLPTLFLATIGVAMCLRNCLFKKRKTGSATQC
jgi:hypothetical protein